MMICDVVSPSVLRPRSPPLLNEEVEDYITGKGESYKEDPKKGYIRPPERLVSKRLAYALIILTTIHTCARRPKIERIVAAGTSNSTPYYVAWPVNRLS